MSLPERVTQRFLASAASDNNTNIPPRIHLRSDAGHLVWLEAPGGRRAFIPDSPMPGDILNQLYAAVLRDRPRIESSWVHDMMVPNNWLDIAIQQDVAVVICYPGFLTSFRRDIDLSAWADALDVHGEVHAVVDGGTCDIMLIGDDGSTGTIPTWTVLWVSDTDPSISTYANQPQDELVVPF